MSMICDVTDSLEANPGPTFSKLNCHLETRKKTLRMDFTVANTGHTLCRGIKLVEYLGIHISGFFFNDVVFSVKTC